MAGSDSSRSKRPASGIAICIAVWWPPRSRSRSRSVLGAHVRQGQGILAKTDQLDARVLALFAAVMAPPVRPVAPQTMAELAELVVARPAPSKRKPRSKSSSGPPRAHSQASAHHHISRAGKDLPHSTRDPQAHQGRASLARRYAVLTSIPGFGFAVAATIIACLAEIGSTTAKQIACSPAWLDRDQSATAKVSASFWADVGPAPVLYLATLSATGWNSDMKDLYKRLIDNPKPSKVALIAWPESSLSWQIPS